MRYSDVWSALDVDVDVDAIQDTLIAVAAESKNSHISLSFSPFLGGVFGPFVFITVSRMLYMYIGGRKSLNTFSPKILAQGV